MRKKYVPRSSKYVSRIHGYKNLKNSRRYVSAPRTAATGYERLKANPFAVAGAFAKIPDGKSNLSAAVKFQQRKEFRTDDKGTLHVFLFAGLNNCVSVWNSVEPNTGTDEATQVAENAKLFAGNLPLSNHIAIEGTGAGVEASPFAAAKYSSNIVDRWRTISVGLSVKLVNSFSETDGWFESVRFQSQNPGTSFAKEGTTSSWFVKGRADFHEAAKANLVENPSYSSGTLSDLTQTLFKLNTIDTQQDFLKLSPQVHDEAVFDRSKDCIYLRIHGRAESGTAGVGTRVLMHCAVNQEIVYDEDSLLSHFHTKSGLNRRVLDRVAARDNYSIKAGTTIVQRTGGRPMVTQSPQPLRRSTRTTTKPQRLFGK